MAGTPETGPPPPKRARFRSQTSNGTLHLPEETDRTVHRLTQTCHRLLDAAAMKVDHIDVEKYALVRSSVFFDPVLSAC